MKLKMIAIAAAVASLTGVARADIVTSGTQDGDLFLYAFDTVTRNWYVRDLGYTINSFLPSSVTTLAGDGGITGDKTPDAGLVLDKTNAANFDDASFSSFVAANTAANIRWAVGAIDDLFNGSTAATSTNRKRVITSSANNSETALNGLIDNYTSTPYAGGIGATVGAMGLSKTMTGAIEDFNSNFLFGEDSLATLDQSVSLFYFSKTRGTLGSTEFANPSVRYGNSTGFATVTLASNGDFTYSLAGEAPAAVPIPAAAWLMGSGLLGLGGVMRRRKAAAQA